MHVTSSITLPGILLNDSGTCDNSCLFIYRNGFQRLNNIKDSNRQSKQLEELTGRMKECKRYVTYWPSIFEIPYLNCSVGLLNHYFSCQMS